MKLKFKLISIITILLPIFLFSNPVQLIYFSELYLDGNDWFIELQNIDDFAFDSDLGGTSFICSAGSTSIKDSTFLFADSVTVITKDDLVTPLNLNRENDFFEIGYLCSEHWGSPDYGIHAPYEGQSIQCCIHGYGPPDYGITTRNYIDNQPTIGEEPYMLHSFATIEMQVYDENNNPLPQFQLVYASHQNGWASTDENGFLSKEIGASKYNLRGIYNEVVYWDSIVYLQPDVLYHFDLYTDITSGEYHQLEIPSYSISNSPNPFNPVTTISFGRVLEQPGQVKIYNSKGGLVDVLNCTTGKESISWDAGTTASGVYFYKLEVEGSEAGKGKMILLK